MKHFPYDFCIDFHLKTCAICCKFKNRNLQELTDNLSVVQRCGGVSDSAHGIEFQPTVRDFKQYYYF